MGLLTLHSFFLILVTVFYKFSTIYLYLSVCYFLILCFYFQVLFLNLLPMGHILQFTMFRFYHSLPVILLALRSFIVQYERKRVPKNYSHGPMIRAGITCKKILLKKFIEFGISFK